VEGDGDIQSFGTTGATWNEYDKSGPTNNWTQAGGDFTQVDSATAVWPDATVEPVVWTNFTVTKIVQGWATGSFPNYGFLIKFDDESVSKGGYFLSRDASAAYGPQAMLEICYSSEFVVPDVPFGTVIAMGAMIMGLVAYFGIPRLPKLIKKY
jgi:hypothetical protein